MTTVLERSIVINATTEAIDRVTLDGARFPEWYAGVQQATPDDLYPEPGGRVALVYRAAGARFNMTMTSLRIVHGHSLLLRMEGMITGKSRWIYTPEGEGTRVSCTFEYDVPGGDVGQAFNKLILERMNAENLEKSLANLKAVVEGD
jgi:hypothetical protein